MSGPQTYPVCIALYAGRRIGAGRPLRVEVDIRDGSGTIVGTQVCDGLAVGHSCKAVGPLNSGPVFCAVNIPRGASRVMRVALILLDTMGHAQATVAWHNET